MSAGLADWGLAERLATGIARRGGGPGEVSAADLEGACENAAGLVVAYAELQPAAPPPAPELLRRDEWAANALVSIEELAGDLDRQAAGALGLPGPLGAVARRLLGSAIGAEAGTVAGLASRKVLGQYDLALVESERRPRLLFVEPNLTVAARELGAAREPFLRWVALHETTHAVQFAAVPWLRGHLGGIVAEMVADARAGLGSSGLRDAAKRALRTDPRRTAGALMRGELARTLAGPRGRALFDRAQATMAVIEGHAEHVMDAAGASEGGYADLRVRMDARRSERSGLGSIVARLLGVELKLRQYRLGKAFCDAVAADAGIAGLNLVWSSPEALPDLAELERPGAWLERVQQASPAAV